jgi:hypothetical protein
MRDQYEVSLIDEELRMEVEVTTELMVAASACVDGRLPQEQIDQILGLAPRTPESRPAVPRPRRP